VTTRAKYTPAEAVGLLMFLGMVQLVLWVTIVGCVVLALATGWIGWVLILLGIYTLDHEIVLRVHGRQIRNLRKSRP
jgi:hypothetical protein